MMVGAHVPAADPLEEAETLDADVVQIFLSNPQSWKKPKPRQDADEIIASSIPIYVHAPYLINLCSDNNRVRIPSRRILQETCDAAAAIEAAGVVVHGGHVTGDEGDIGDAFGRWRKALDQVESEVPILIENTAGGDHAVARRFQEMARLWDEIGEYGVGFVLDTCHAWAGGEPLEGIVERAMAATGRVDLLHLNDSRDPFDSRRDRHTNIGKGEIPLRHLETIVRSADCPIIVETPGDQAADIAWVRRTLGGG